VCCAERNRYAKLDRLGIVVTGTRVPDAGVGGFLTGCKSSVSSFIVKVS
jgi:hypothetical protein